MVPGQFIGILKLDSIPKTSSLNKLVKLATSVLQLRVTGSQSGSSNLSDTEMGLVRFGNGYLFEEYLISL